MIDAYMWGEINRMSPEAEVPVVEVKKHENRLGGAANVALNLQSLGAEPILCSVIGDDKKGLLFEELMRDAGLSTKGILKANRKTTLKTRIIANNKHQLRIDEEETHAVKDDMKFLNLIKGLISDIDVIILQDYNKGVLSPKIITEIINLTKIKKLPTIVDPKKMNFNCYKNCTIFKPNLSEIQEGMKINLNQDNKKEIEKTSSKLRKNLNTEAILLTLSSRGICINTREKFTHTPALKRRIIDVSGAGDTVISVAALCLASNLDYVHLSMLSNIAGGIVCEEVGVVPVNKDKLLAEAKEIFSND